MKTNRHRKIVDIIQRKPVETQEELAEELKREGFNVTQATISRDIKELRLVKIATGNNLYRYAVPDEKLISGNQVKNRRIFTDSVTRMDFSENIIIVKTSPGAAQAVAAVIDNEGLKEIIGSVAGDDTVLVVVKPITAVQTILDYFSNYLEK